MIGAERAEQLRALTLQTYLAAETHSAKESSSTTKFEFGWIVTGNWLLAMSIHPDSSRLLAGRQLNTEGVVQPASTTFCARLTGSGSVGRGARRPTADPYPSESCCIEAYERIRV